MNNHFAPEAPSAPTLHPEISAEQLKVLIANLFLYRRQKDMPCSWHIPLGVPMNSIALHTYLGMQAFIAFAVRMGLSKEAIGLGLLLFLNHDLDELITVDKNIYSSPFLKVDNKSAMLCLQEGHPFRGLNLHIDLDYDLGKKGKHEVELLNLVCTLLKDIDGLERILEQLEKVARGAYPERRWRRPEVQAENAYKADNYNHDLVRAVHNMIIKKDLAIFRDPSPDESIKDADEHTFAQNLFEERKEQELGIVAKVRYVFMGVHNNRALQTYFRMQVYVVLGQLSDLNRSEIAKGLFKMMTEISIFESNPDPLIEDACLLEELLEHLEDAALAKLDYWNLPGNIAARDYTHQSYSTSTARWLHEAIVAYGLDAFDDAFLRLPNMVKSGTHGKHP